MEIYGFIDGEKKSLTQLAAESGVSYDTLLRRYKAGVPFGELVNKAEGGGVSEEMLKEFFAQSFQAVYPVGAIYISTVATNPETLFGFGAWQQIQDRFLLAAGSSYAAGATGGAATHTLTAAQMPKHRHTLALWNNAGTKGPAKTTTNYGAGTTDTTAGLGNATWGTWQNASFQAAQGGMGDQFGLSREAGNGEAHNNMPPYLAVYVWKRVS